MLNLDSAVVRGLSELRNRDFQIIEVSEQEFIQSMKCLGKNESEICIHLIALKNNTQMIVNDGFRIVLKNTN